MIRYDLAKVDKPEQQIGLNPGKIDYPAVERVMIQDLPPSGDTLGDLTCILRDLWYSSEMTGYLWLFVLTLLPRIYN